MSARRRSAGRQKRFVYGCASAQRESICVVKSEPLSLPSRCVRDDFMPRTKMIEPEEFPDTDSPQVTNISHSDVQSVRAELVRMHQADAESITAEEVEMQNSAAGSLKAVNVTGRMVLAGVVNAEEISIGEGAVGYVQAQKASISGYTGAVVAGSADVRNSLVGYVAGTDVHVEGSRTGILIARNVNGNVTTLLDTRSALIAGLVGGLFAGIMLLLGRMLFGRK